MLETWRFAFALSSQSSKKVPMPDESHVEPVSGNWKIVETDADVQDIIEEAEGKMEAPPVNVPSIGPDWKEKYLTPKTPEQVAPTAFRPKPPPPPDLGPVMPIERGDTAVFAKIRQLYLMQGWGPQKIAKHLRIDPVQVRNHVVTRGLPKKRKEKTWTPEDLMTPQEAAQAVIERELKQERAAVAAAQRVAQKGAGEIVAVALSREQVARDASLRIAGKLEAMAARIEKAIEHMERDQDDLDTTSARDLKDLTAAQLNLVRAALELANERGTSGQAKGDKTPPIRIGVVGTVRITGGSGESGIEVSQ